jgi:hypothetical protein
MDYDEQAAPFTRPFQYVLAGGNSAIANARTRTHGVMVFGISK